MVTYFYKIINNRVFMRSLVTLQNTQVKGFLCGLSSHTFNPHSRPWFSTGER